MSIRLQNCVRQLLGHFGLFWLGCRSESYQWDLAIVGISMVLPRFDRVLTLVDFASCIGASQRNFLRLCMPMLSLRFSAIRRSAWWASRILGFCRRWRQGKRLLSGSWHQRRANRTSFHFFRSFGQPIILSVYKHRARHELRICLLQLRKVSQCLWF